MQFIGKFPYFCVKFKRPFKFDTTRIINTITQYHTNSSFVKKIKVILQNLTKNTINSHASSTIFPSRKIEILFEDDQFKRSFILYTFIGNFAGGI